MRTKANPQNHSIPPMQSPLGMFVQDHRSPIPFPDYRFAMAMVDRDDGLEVTTAIPRLQLDGEFLEPGETVVERVTQTYVVRVPYEEIIDGETAQKARETTRTRTVPVTNLLPRRPTRENDSEEQFVERSYTIAIPYTETDADGISRMHSRLETRTRTVSSLEPTMKYVSQEVCFRYELNHCQCFNTHGVELSPEEVRLRLSKPTPILVLTDPVYLTDYFASLLSPDIVVLIEPKQERVFQGAE